MLEGGQAWRWETEEGPDVQPTCQGSGRLHPCGRSLRPSSQLRARGRSPACAHRTRCPPACLHILFLLLFSYITLGKPFLLASSTSGSSPVKQGKWSSPPRWSRREY